MPSRLTRSLLILLPAIACVAALLLYPFLPDRIASHWNAAGEVNGYMPKIWGVFLVPGLMILFLGLRALILRANTIKTATPLFQDSLDTFWLLLSSFFLYVFILTTAWNLGPRFNTATALIPGLSALFYGIGALLPKTERNGFVGIRTPWTLSSDLVWKKTHRLGGVLFQGSAGIALLGMVFSSGLGFVLTVILPVLLASIVTTGYSFLEYRKNTP